MAINLFTGATNSNWGTSTNWSLAAVPTAADGNVTTFNVTSPNCTVDTSARVCNAIDFTGYTGTITMTNQISVSGDVTLGSGMGIAGAAALRQITTGNFTSNGKIWPNPLTITQTGTTTTLLDNLKVSGTLTIGSSSGTNTINGFQIEATGSVSLGTTSGVVTGTTTLLMSGTGTFTPASSTGTMRMPFTINTAGSVTFANGSTFRYSTSTFTCSTPANVVTTNVALTLTAANTTFDSNGLVWTSVGILSAFTFTFSSDVYCTGLLTVGAGTSTSTILNGANIYVAGGLAISVTSGTLTGTTVINLTGTGSIASIQTTGRLSLTTVINAPNGTITITTAATFVDLAQIKLVAGTVVTTAGTWSTGGITQFSTTF